MSDNYYGKLAVSKLTELCTTRKTTAEFPPYSNEPSWDGFIMYQPYEDNKKGLKKIHVQIKGRKDDGNNRFSIDRIDLENYKANGGILFLVTKFKSDNEYRHLYKLMMPSEISDYLISNQSDSITIRLRQLFNKEKIIEICETYALKSNDIFDSAMHISYMPSHGEIKRVKTIINDAVIDGLALSNENMYISFETNHGRYYVDGVKLDSFKSNQKYNVRIDKSIYFDSALVEKKHDVIKLIFNSCLIISLCNNSFNIEFDSLGMFIDVINALHFLTNIKNDSFVFGDSEIKLDNITNLCCDYKLSEHYNNLLILKKILEDESHTLNFKLKALTYEEQMEFSRRIDYVKYSKLDICKKMPKLYFNGYVNEFYELYKNNASLIESDDKYLYIRCIKMIDDNKKDEVYEIVKKIEWDNSMELGLLEIQLDLFFDNGDFAKVIECCNKYLQYKGNNKDIFNMLGVAFMRIGESDKAKDIFVKAIKKYPDFFKLHYNLALYYHMIGKYDLSLNEVNEAEKLKHDDKYVILRNDLLNLLKDFPSEG